MMESTRRYSAGSHNLKVRFGLATQTEQFASAKVVKSRLRSH